MNQQKPSFDGLRVAAFESRRSEELSRLIAKHGGRPHVSVSMREVPLAGDGSAVEFARQLIRGGIDMMIILTGVGFRRWLELVERRMDRKEVLGALSQVVTVARGPKSAAALREAGVAPTHRVAEPNTWRELLAALDDSAPVAGRTVGLQEYGQTNPSLLAGLEARGARVVRIRVYGWELPEDTGPLEENVRAVAEGRRDVVLFTAASQAANVHRIAARLGLIDSLQQRLGDLVVGSVGPMTSEMLRRHDWPVDLEPRRPKMGSLVAVAAQRSADLLARKRQVRAVLARPADSPSDSPAPWRESAFLKACRREPCDVTPIWLMRQAGRYMAEYREIRSKVSFLDLCRNPALCSEVMVTAVERLGVDAAIIFSDLLPILEPMGLELEYAPDAGPVIHNPVREGGEVDRVLELESVESLHFVIETVRRTRADLRPEIPLIGFAGAPFTLASYVIEGGASRSHLHTKTLMYRDEGAWRELMQRLARAIIAYLNAQIAAGAQCVQLFDSWAGCLSPDDYRRYAFPYVRQVIEGVGGRAPVISFATGNPALLPLLSEAGADVVGVDWRIRLDEAWRLAGFDKAVQGNLDPAALLADRREIRRFAKEILRQAAGRPGHIFNLGHGVLPQTPVDNAVALVDAVHEEKRGQDSFPAGGGC